MGQLSRVRLKNTCSASSSVAIEGREGLEGGWSGGILEIGGRRIGGEIEPMLYINPITTTERE